jgi:hypothetical protein
MPVAVVDRDSIAGAITVRFATHQPASQVTSHLLAPAARRA